MAARGSQGRIRTWVRRFIPLDASGAGRTRTRVEEMRASKAYRTAAAGWEGSLLLVLRAEPGRGVPEDLGVNPDLGRGEGREGRAEAEMFLTTFLWKEPKHVDFFHNGFVRKVIGEEVPAETGYEAYDVVPVGLRLEEFMEIASTNFGRRMQRIERARRQTLDEVYGLDA